MEPRGIMGGLYRLMEWIMRLAVINVLWLLCASPFFIMLAMSIYATLYYGSIDYFTGSLWILALVSPFTFFPSTAAMFAVARKWIMGDVDVPLFQTYFKNYKENFLQSMFGGLLAIVIFATLYLNYMFYLNQPGALNMLSALFIALALFVICAVIHFFSIMVHFHMRFWQIVKNSAIVTISNPIMAFVLLSSNAFIAYVSFSLMRFLIPVFFMGSLMAVVSYWNFSRIYDRMKMIMDKQKETEQEEPEKSEGETGTAETGENSSSSVPQSEQTEIKPLEDGQSKPTAGSSDDQASPSSDNPAGGESASPDSKTSSEPNQSGPRTNRE